MVCAVLSNGTQQQWQHTSFRCGCCSIPSSISQVLLSPTWRQTMLTLPFGWLYSLSRSLGWLHLGLHHSNKYHHLFATAAATPASSTATTITTFPAVMAVGVDDGSEFTFPSSLAAAATMPVTTTAAMDVMRDITNQNAATLAFPLATTTSTTVWQMSVAPPGRQSRRLFCQHCLPCKSITAVPTCLQVCPAPHYLQLLGFQQLVNNSQALLNFMKRLSTMPKPQTLQLAGHSHTTMMLKPLRKLMEFNQSSNEWFTVTHFQARRRTKTALFKLFLDSVHQPLIMKSPRSCWLIHTQPSQLSLMAAGMWHGLQTSHQTTWLLFTAFPNIAQISGRPRAMLLAKFLTSTFLASFSTVSSYLQKI